MATHPPGASYDAPLDWTHPLISPSPDPLLWLTPAGRTSFVANDLNHLAAWLQRAGWRREPGRSPSEHSRFLRGRQLIVLYRTTTVLVQGARPEATVALLRQLVCEEQPAVVQKVLL